MRQISLLEIQVMRRWTLVYVAIVLLGLLGFTFLLAPSGAWYIPGGTFLGLTAVLLWVSGHDDLGSLAAADEH